MARFDANEDEDKDKDKSGNLIPKGRHVVRVTGHEDGASSGGYGQLIVTYTDGEGRTRKDWLIYEGAARWQLSSLVHTQHDEGASAPVFDTARPAEVRRALYGRDLEIVVDEEVYQGKSGLRVKYRNRIKGAVSRAPAGGGGGRPYGSAGQFGDSDSDSNTPNSGDDSIPF